MKTIYPLLFVLLVSSVTFSQNSKDTLTLPEKFDKIYRTSSSYQEYKVIGKTRFKDLKQQVTDSLNTLKKEVQVKDQLISSQKDSINTIDKIASNFKADLNLTIAQKNSITILGVEILKSTYNIIVWSLIALLTIFLLYFAYRFKNSNEVTIKVKDDFQELEENFAIHKKKSLENEQKLRRQLQDEINKHRGV